MGFNVAKAKQDGYSDQEIADHLASQNRFNAAKARADGYSDQEIIAHLNGGAPTPSARQTQPGAWENLQSAMTAGAGLLQGKPAEMGRQGRMEFLERTNPMANLASKFAQRDAFGLAQAIMPRLPGMQFAPSENMIMAGLELMPWQRRSNAEIEAEGRGLTERARGRYSDQMTRDAGIDGTSLNDVIRMVGESIPETALGAAQALAGSRAAPAALARPIGNAVAGAAERALPGFLARSFKPGVDGGRGVIGAMTGAASEGSSAALSAASSQREQSIALARSDPEAFARSPAGKQALIITGGNLEAAIKLVAEQEARRVFQSVGPITAAAGVVGGPFESSLFSGGMRGMIKGGIKGGLSEMPEEALQSGSEQFLSNLSATQGADPNRELWSGVGEAAVQGALVGGVMGGATGVAGGGFNSAMRGAKLRAIQGQREALGRGSMGADALRNARAMDAEQTPLEEAEREQARAKAQADQNEAGRPEFPNPLRLTDQRAGRNIPPLDDATVAAAAAVDERAKVEPILNRMVNAERDEIVRERADLEPDTSPEIDPNYTHDEVDLVDLGPVAQRDDIQLSSDGTVSVRAPNGAIEAWRDSPLVESQQPVIDSLEYFSKTGWRPLKELTAARPPLPPEAVNDPNLVPEPDTFSPEDYAVVVGTAKNTGVIRLSDFPEPHMADAVVAAAKRGDLRQVGEGVFAYADQTGQDSRQEAPPRMEVPPNAFDAGSVGRGDTPQTPTGAPVRQPTEADLDPALGPTRLEVRPLPVGVETDPKTGRTLPMRDRAAFDAKLAATEKRRAELLAEQAALREQLTAIPQDTEETTDGQFGMRNMKRFALQRKIAALDIKMARLPTGKAQFAVVETNGVQSRVVSAHPTREAAEAARNPEAKTKSKPKAAPEPTPEERSQARVFSDLFDRLKTDMKGLIGNSLARLVIKSYIRRADPDEAPTEGYYDEADRLIVLARDIYGIDASDPLALYMALKQVMHHEIIHLLRSEGKITDAEFNRMVKESKKLRYIGKDGEPTKYTLHQRAQFLYENDQAYQSPDGTPNQDAIDEEAVAEMFRQYMNDPAGRRPYVKMLDRIIGFLRRLGKWANSADRYMARIAAGEVGMREQGARPDPLGGRRNSTSGVLPTGDQAALNALNAELESLKDSKADTAEQIAAKRKRRPEVFKAINELKAKIKGAVAAPVRRVNTLPLTEADNDVEPFGSNLLSAFDGDEDFPNEASAGEWRTAIQKLQNEGALNGVKEDEVVFSGIMDWLELKRQDAIGRGEKPSAARLTKAEVRAFLADNRLMITEKVWGNGVGSVDDDVRDEWIGDRASELQSEAFYHHYEEPDYDVVENDGEEIEDEDGNPTGEYEPSTYTLIFDGEEQGTYDTAGEALAEVDSLRDTHRDAAQDDWLNRYDDQYYDEALEEWDDNHSGDSVPYASSYQWGTQPQVHALVYKPKGKDYTLGHGEFNLHNMLAFIQSSIVENDETGESTMLVDGAQSDWHKDGVKRGYSIPGSASEINAAQADVDATRNVVLEDAKKVVEALKRLPLTRMIRAAQQNVVHAEKAAETLGSAYNTAVRLREDSRYTDEERFNKTDDSAKRIYAAWNRARDRQTAALSLLRDLRLIDGHLHRAPEAIAAESQTIGRTLVGYAEFLNELADRTARTGLGNVAGGADIPLIMSQMPNVEDNYRALQEAEDRRHLALTGGGGAPNAPYKKLRQWLTLLVKRAIRVAVERGVDNLAFITGNQTNAGKTGGNKFVTLVYGTEIPRILESLTKPYQAEIVKTKLRSKKSSALVVGDGDQDLPSVIEARKLYDEAEADIYRGSYGGYTTDGVKKKLAVYNKDILLAKLHGNPDPDEIRALEARRDRAQEALELHRLRDKLLQQLVRAQEKKEGADPDFLAGRYNYTLKINAALKEAATTRGSPLRRQSKSGSLRGRGRPKKSEGLDVRANILAAATDAVRRGGPEAFSIREVSRALGVSSSAYMNHFIKDGGVLGAVAKEGWRELDAVMSASNDPPRAYVKFTREEPGLFAAMSSRRDSEEAKRVLSSLIKLRYSKSGPKLNKGGDPARRLEAEKARLEGINKQLKALRLTGDETAEKAGLIHIQRKPLEEQRNLTVEKIKDLAKQVAGMKGDGSASREGKPASSKVTYNRTPNESDNDIDAFGSNLIAAFDADQSLPREAAPKDWLVAINRIGGQGEQNGVKDDEIKYSFIREWLGEKIAADPEQALTKAEVRQYLVLNRVRMRVQTKTEVVGPKVRTQEEEDRRAAEIEDLARGHAGYGFAYDSVTDPYRVVETEQQGPRQGPLATTTYAPILYEVVDARDGSIVHEADGGWEEYNSAYEEAVRLNRLHRKSAMSAFVDANWESYRVEAEDDWERGNGNPHVSMPYSSIWWAQMDRSIHGLIMDAGWNQDGLEYPEVWNAQVHDLGFPKTVHSFLQTSTAVDRDGNRVSLAEGIQSDMNKFLEKEGAYRGADPVKVAEAQAAYDAAVAAEGTYRQELYEHVSNNLPFDRLRFVLRDMLARTRQELSAENQYARALEDIMYGGSGGWPNEQIDYAVREYSLSQTREAKLVRDTDQARTILDKLHMLEERITPSAYSGTPAILEEAVPGASAESIKTLGGLIRSADYGLAPLLDPIVSLEDFVAAAPNTEAVRGNKNRALKAKMAAEEPAGVPSAAFLKVKQFLTLGVKLHIRKAVEQGFDRVSFITTNQTNGGVGGLNGSNAYTRNVYEKILLEIHRDLARQYGTEELTYRSGLSVRKNKGGASGDVLVSLRTGDDALPLNVALTQEAVRKSERDTLRAVGQGLSSDAYAAMSNGSTDAELDKMNAELAALRLRSLDPQDSHPNITRAIASLEYRQAEMMKAHKLVLKKRAVYDAADAAKANPDPIEPYQVSGDYNHVFVINEAMAKDAGTPGSPLRRYSRSGLRLPRDRGSQDRAQAREDFKESARDNPLGPSPKGPLAEELQAQKILDRQQVLADKIRGRYTVLADVLGGTRTLTGKYKRDKNGKLIGKTKGQVRADEFLSITQDRQLAISRLIDSVMKQGGSVTEANDVAMMATLFPGASASELETLVETLYKPAVEAMAKVKNVSGLLKSIEAAFPQAKKLVSFNSKMTPSQKVVFFTMFAQHAPERNAFVKNVRKRTNPDGSPMENGSGMFDHEARAILNAVQASSHFNAINKAVAAQRAIINDTNNRRIREDLSIDWSAYRAQLELDAVDQSLPKERRDEAAEQLRLIPDFKFYVPLRGFAAVATDQDMQESEDGIGLLTGQLPDKGEGGMSSGGYRVAAREDKRIKGRTSTANDIFSAIILQNQESVIRAHKNRVGNALLQLVKDNPELLKDVVRVVEYASKQPVIGKDGAVRMQKASLSHGNRFTFVTKVAGQEVVMEILDPKLAEAMMYQNDISESMIFNFLKSFRSIVRIQSRLATSLNMNFWASNPTKDVQTATLQVTQYEPKAARQILPRFTKIMGGLVTQDKKTLAQYHELKVLGGYTGAFQARSLDEVMRDTARAINAKHGLGHPAEVTGEALLAAIHALEKVTEATEVATRLAVYQTFLDLGYSKKYAAMMAKTATTDFNTKGRIGTDLSALYMFANASIQGTKSYLHFLASPAGIAATAALASLGVLQEMMNGDDERYKLIEEDKKERNFIFMVPQEWMDNLHAEGLVSKEFAERGYMMLPKPWGFNIPHEMGRQFIRGQRGDISWGTASVNILATTMSAFNPLGSQNPFMAIIPSWGRPPAEIVLNRNWNNKPITPEQIGRVGKINSANYNDRASDASVWLARNLSRLGGSEGDYKPADIPIFEINPHWIDHLVGTYLSGFGKSVAQLTDMGFFLADPNATVNRAASGKGPVGINQMPLVRVVLGEVDERSLTSRYQEVTLSYIRLQKNLKAYQEDGGPALASFIAKNGRDLGTAAAVTDMERARVKIQKQRRDIQANPRMSQEQKARAVTALKAQEQGIMEATLKMIARSQKRVP